jgi:S-(hydroxymethyl)glutathione dehydrogenase/alcohol dehydrogenase
MSRPDGRVHRNTQRRFAEPLTIEDIVVDPPKAHEIRIRIICTSLCHTDVTFWKAKVYVLCM